jgi:hypothetical protein
MKKPINLSLDLFDKLQDVCLPDDLISLKISINRPSYHNKIDSTLRAYLFLGLMIPIICEIRKGVEDGL